MKEKWWQSEIVYQIYPKSFYDSNKDGIGDIRGIIEKLDYLADLGITCLWICPIFQSPMADNGYDISDYFTIDPQFGHIDDVKELIEQAKKRGIKILLDLVVNHTSDEHAWFQAALEDETSPYRDYYIFKSGKTKPNNWRSIFGGSVWEKIPDEDIYYYHTFDKKQPDLNWENPQLREEIYRIVNSWLEMGIAGFRIDAITFIKKEQSYQSIQADGVDGLAKCTKVSRNQPGIDVFLKELKARCFEQYDCMTVAEAPGVPYDQLNRFIGDDGYFSMIFDFKHADLDVESGSEWFKRKCWSLADLYQILQNSQEAIQKSGWGAPFIENHDQPRSTSKYLLDQARNPNAVKSLALAYFFLQGTPFIYQGQEIGMVNFKRESITDFDDVSSIDQYYRGIAEGLTAEEALRCVNLRSRDNSRTPMQWKEEQYVGFSSVEPWLSVTEQSPVRNIASQEEEKDSVLNFYKEMIALKKDGRYSALRTGEIDFPERLVEDVWLYRRYDADTSYLVVVNLSDRYHKIPWSESQLIQLLSSGDGVKQENNCLRVPAYSGALCKEEKK